jgi:arylsulfatase
MSDNGADSFSVVDQAMLKRELLPGDRGSNWQPGTGRACASMTPWRLYKIRQHAGGVTTGAIAWWPGATGQAGRIESSPVHMVDVMPTLLAAAESSTTKVAGESFLPLLKGQHWNRKGTLYFQYMDNRAIRTAEWTMAEVDGASWELRRASVDPLENENLAAKNPAIVADLDARCQQWWREESGKSKYQPASTRGSPHYKPQGDRGSGALYIPSAMPTKLANRCPGRGEGHPHPVGRPRTQEDPSPTLRVVSSPAADFERNLSGHTRPLFGGGQTISQRETGSSRTARRSVRTVGRRVQDPRRLFHSWPASRNRFGRCCAEPC